MSNKMTTLDGELFESKCKCLTTTTEKHQAIAQTAKQIKLTSLCIGRFEALVPLFANLFQADLAVLTEDELEREAEFLKLPGLLVKVFIRTQLRMYWRDEDTDPFVTDAQKEVGLQVQSAAATIKTEAKTSSALLDLRGLLVSEPFAAMKRSAFPVCADLMKYDFFQNFTDWGQVRTIDVQSNSLSFDADATHLCAFVKQACQKGCQQVTVDMSLNRLPANTAVAQALLVMLNEQQVACVVITGNPIATVDAKTLLFQHLDSKTAAKLIFLRERWLNSDSWKTLFSSQLVDVILNRHKAYYNSTTEQQQD